jgi:hypothetical protein
MAFATLSQKYYLPAKPARPGRWAFGLLAVLLNLVRLGPEYFGRYPGPNRKHITQNQDQSAVVIPEFLNPVEVANKDY